MNMKMHPNDASNNEVLQAIQSLVLRFDGLESRFDEMGEAMQFFVTTVDTRFDSVDKRFDHLESDIYRMKAVMVTKDYLDDKLANQYSDIVQWTRREIARAK